MNNRTFRQRARAVVLLGALLSITAPALAKDTVDPDPVQMSDGFRAGVSAVRSALAAGQWSSADSMINALSPFSDFESYTKAGLRFELATVRRDMRAQRAALVPLLKDRLLPAKEAPRLHFAAAWFAYMLGDNDDALAHLGQAKALGYDAPDAALLSADLALRKNRLKDARPFVDEALARERAAGRRISEPWYDRAILMAWQAGDWKAVGTLYRERLSLYPSREAWRSALVNIVSAPGLDTQRQLDLYRLQAANGAMASERDYLAYATLAEKAGYNAEAKTVLDAGRAAGKLEPTQKASSLLLKTVAPKATKELAGLADANRKAGAASGGSASLAVADRYFSVGQYAQAATGYRDAIRKGGIDDNRAHSRLGVALARSGDLDGASAELAQADGDWREVAGFWTVWVDQQRGQAAAG